MPNAGRNADYGKTLSGELGARVPQMSAPFNLTICGSVVWMLGGLALLGVLIALGFAVFNNTGANRTGSFDDSEFEPEFEFDFSDLLPDPSELPRR